MLSLVIAPVAPEMLRTLAIRSDTGFRKSAVDWEDLKQY